MSYNISCVLQVQGFRAVLCCGGGHDDQTVLVSIVVWAVLILLHRGRLHCSFACTCVNYSGTTYVQYMVADTSFIIASCLAHIFVL